MACGTSHNEYGCHNRACYCDDVGGRVPRLAAGAATATLDALNDAWGTAFWSQRYYDWDEILPPRPAGRPRVNPTQQLDFWRFYSDELLLLPGRGGMLAARSRLPVTTNYM